MKIYLSLITLFIVIYSSSVQAQVGYRGKLKDSKVIWYSEPVCSYNDFENWSDVGSDNYYKNYQSDFSELPESSESETGPIDEEFDNVTDEENPESETESEIDYESENISELYLKHVESGVMDYRNLNFKSGIAYNLCLFFLDNFYCFT